MSMQASIDVSDDPQVRYLLRLGDACLVHAQRLAEWSGHAPALEEDIALSNMALDLVGQARALLTLAGLREGRGHDEDQLAFLRDERDFHNPTLVELPRGDFAFTVLRNLFVATWLEGLWQALQESTDSELAAIAAKAVKEAHYHRQYAATWVVRLGDGSEESTRRMRAALQRLWPYTAELFDDDAIDLAAEQSGLGPTASSLQASWLGRIDDVLEEALLERPVAGRFLSTGKQGRHSEHMGYLLAEMQTLPRSFPGGAW